MQQLNELMEVISKADKVLIGIGEEFSIEKDESYKKDEKYSYVEGLKERDEISPVELKFIDDVLRKDFYSDTKNCEDSIIYNAYQKLYNILLEKDYFIVTMNSDDLLERVGLSEERIVKPCGNWNWLQCSDNCSNNIIDGSEIFENIKQRIIKHETIEMPKCVSCGERLVINKVGSENYCEEGYMSQWNKYMKWLSMTINRNLCIVELGVGFKYPTVIRWPFEKTAFYNNKSTFFRINESFPQMTKELADKGISVEKNAVDFILSV